MRGVRRNRTDVSVTDGLETASSHVMGHEPAEDGSGPALGKLEVAAGYRQIIRVAVDTGRCVWIRDGEEAQQPPQLGHCGWRKHGPARAEQDAGQRIGHGAVETLPNRGAELAARRRSEDHGPAGTTLV